MSNNENNDFLTVGTGDINTSTGGEFKPLEEGLYPAVCVGITVRETDNFDKTGKEDKMQFVFQIVEEGQTYYVRSKPLKKSLHEKAGLWKLLASWTKQPNAETLISKMGTNGKFDIRYFIGKPIQLTIKQKEYKGKEYPEISDYMAPKKGQLTTVKFDTIPSFIVTGVKEQYFIDGITVKGETCISEEPSEDAKELGLDKEDGDSLPFN